MLLKKSLIALGVVFLVLLAIGGTRLHLFKDKMSKRVSKQTSEELRQVVFSGANSSNLKMYLYAPSSASPASASKDPMPLVVALHGCLQNAAEYARDTGWNSLAEKHRFVVLYPEQPADNNFMTCYNWTGKWWDKHSVERGKGEGQSIMEMIEKVKSLYPIDKKRIYVTGISAGGVQTVTMLALWPDVFAGGAPIAGLPYHAADKASEAIKCMNPGKVRPAPEWAELVRKGFPGYTGPYPTISIWHGTNDTVVHPINLDEIAKQWTALHKVAPKLTKESAGNNQKHVVYYNSKGEAVVETHLIIGMKHAVPVYPGPGEEQGGVVDRFAEDQKIFSSYWIGKFWKLF